MKTLKHMLSEQGLNVVVKDETLETGTVENLLPPGPLNHIKKFAKQLSNAFQPNVPAALEKIEVELNKFGYTLGEIDMDEPFGSEGEESFVIVAKSSDEVQENVYLTLKYKELSSGQQYQYRSDGSELRYDVRLVVNEVDPEDFEWDETGSDVGEFAESVEELEEAGIDLSQLSDSQLKASLKRWRDTDQQKYNAAVSEMESRGLKEAAFTHDDTDASDDSGSIIMALRKAKNLGSKEFKFDDGSRKALSRGEADKLLLKYDSLSKPSDKMTMQSKLKKSVSSFQAALREDAEKVFVKVETCSVEEGDNNSRGELVLHMSGTVNGKRVMIRSGMWVAGGWALKHASQITGLAKQVYIPAISNKSFDTSEDFRTAVHAADDVFKKKVSSYRKKASKAMNEDFDGEDGDITESVIFRKKPKRLEADIGETKFAFRVDAKGSIAFEINGETCVVPPNRAGALLDKIAALYMEHTS